MSKKNSVFIFGGLVFLVIGIGMYASKDEETEVATSISLNSLPTDQTNVSTEDGTQVIAIEAKGGYRPQVTQAKAGMPTVLKFATNGTFDCSSAVRIPSMNISQYLPSSGMTEVDVGSQKVGVLQGTCSMGMYRFQVQFN